MKNFRGALWGLASVSVVALATTGCSQSSDQQQAQQQQQQAKSAQVDQLSTRDIKLNKSYPAKVRSDNSADVTARVQGVLESQIYKPGDIVKKGQPLFKIEPDTYQAKVEQARGELASAQANYENAVRDNRRYQELYRRGAISAQSRDSYANTAATDKAAVAQARATLRQAQINLNYSTVRATASGQVSLNEVNVGQLVSSGDKLASVTPINPLEVRFQIPQSDAQQIRKQQSMSGVPKIGVSLQIDGDSSDSLQGHLDFVGDNVNSDTNTVQARAVFDNPKGIFMPGQYAHVHLDNLMRFNVIAVPEIAITQGLMGPQVYALDGDNKIKPVDVVPGDVTADWQIINSGLKANDRVVVSDPGSLNTGDTVDPQPFDGNPDKNQQQGSDQQHNDSQQSSDGE